MGINWNINYFKTLREIYLICIYKHKCKHFVCSKADIQANYCVKENFDFDLIASRNLINNFLEQHKSINVECEKKTHISLCLL